MSSPGSVERQVRMLRREHFATLREMREATDPHARQRLAREAGSHLKHASWSMAARHESVVCCAQHLV